MLVRDPKARRLHDNGLAAELRGDFDEAHGQFREALLSVPGYDGERIWTPASEVQAAAIVRDDGFTDVRAAIQMTDLDTLHRSSRRVGHAAVMLAPLLQHHSYLARYRNKSRELSTEELRELRSEHGATLGCIARIGTVARILFEINLGTEDYERAHELLENGSNGYYLVSNAMCAARAARTRSSEGEPVPEVKIWLGRAAAGLAYTTAHDLSNLYAASRTFFGRRPHARSQQTAIDSVRVKP